MLEPLLWPWGPRSRPGAACTPPGSAGTLLTAGRDYPELSVLRPGQQPLHSFVPLDTQQPAHLTDGGRERPRHRPLQLTARLRVPLPHLTQAARGQ